MASHMPWTLEVILIESTGPPSQGRMGRLLAYPLISVAFLSHRPRDRAGWLPVGAPRPPTAPVEVRVCGLGASMRDLMLRISVTEQATSL